MQALKLTDIERNNDTGAVRLTPEDKRYAPFDAPPNWYERYGGEDAGTGYFVRYDDDFASWSPSWAFEAGYTLISGSEGDELTFKSPLDIAELARGVAGAARFFADGAVGAPGLFDREEAAIMADFVRGNPDAPVEAMFIHLGLQKRYVRTEPNRADLFVLSLFHAACKAAFKFEADQTAEAEAAKVKPEPSGRWPGERAMQPSDPVFAPTGFSPR